MCDIHMTYVYVYICIYVHIPYAHVHVAYMYIYAYLNEYIYMYIYIYVCIHVYTEYMNTCDSLGCVRLLGTHARQRYGAHGRNVRQHFAAGRRAFSNGLASNASQIEPTCPGRRVCVRLRGCISQRCYL